MFQLRQIKLSTPRTADNNHLISSLLLEELTNVESTFESCAAETAIVPFSSHRLNVFTDNRLFALQTFWSSLFSALGLAIEAPRVAILFDVAHAFLERITTFSTEEVFKMPMLAKCDCMLADDRCLAMLAPGSEGFMPVKMTEVA